MTLRIPRFADPIEYYEKFLNSADSKIPDEKKSKTIIRDLLMKSKHKFIGKITELKNESSYISDYQQYERLLRFLLFGNSSGISDYIQIYKNSCFDLFNNIIHPLLLLEETEKNKKKFSYKVIVCLLKNSIILPFVLTYINNVKPEIMKICYKQLLKYSGRFLVRVNIQNIIVKYAQLYQFARKILELVQPNAYYDASKNQIDYISWDPKLVVTDTKLYNFRAEKPMVTKKTDSLLKIGELEPKQQYKLYLIAKNAPGLFVDLSGGNFRKNTDINYEFYIPIGVELLIYGIDRLKTGTRKLYKKIRKSQIYDPQIYRVISQFTYGIDRDNYFYKKTQYLS